MSSYLLAIAITNYEPVESSVEGKVKFLLYFLNDWYTDVCKNGWTDNNPLYTLFDKVN